MSYRFCFGASGAGKSYTLHREVIGRSGGSPGAGHFIVLVPEQYTMQTQKEMVLASPGCGIMDIDVLSFGRLAHRVFEEVGADGRTMLDDTGKSLILRRLVGLHAKELTTLGNRAARPGMIDEIKSVLSEFMQYDVSPDDLERLIRYAKDERRNALSGRLKDLRVLYDAFLKYKEERFITSEETLDLLAAAIPHSKMLKGSVVVLDGFTGFTPIQYKVIRALLTQCGEVIVSLMLSEDGGPGPAGIVKYGSSGGTGSEEQLFSLSRRTAADIMRLAYETGCPHGEDIVLAGDDPEKHRFRNAPALAHLERHLLRRPAVPYTAVPECIKIAEASSPEEEVRQMCIRIAALIREEGYEYRDIAVISSDPETYDDLIEKMALRYAIPVYIDRTRSALENPLTQTVRSALMAAAEDLPYDKVFHYLRSGLSGLTMEQTDLLENYCLEHGIRGARKWSLPFGEAEEPLRQIVLKSMEPLLTLSSSSSGKVRCAALRSFAEQGKFEERMERWADDLAQEGDRVRELEFRQVYGAVMKLISQMEELLGDESISDKEFSDILEAGFAQIKVGTLPQGVDVVLAGDMERTRIPQIRALFFLGVNEGLIPRSGAGGGLIPDHDRELLKSCADVTLAPSPKDLLYIQRLYLYMDLTRPSEKLFLSYATMTADGKTQTPSYLIGQLQQIFPALEIRCPERLSFAQQITSERDAMPYLADGLRNYRVGLAEKGSDGEKALFSLFAALGGGSDEPEIREETLLLKDAAFRRYHGASIQHETSEAVFGSRIAGSVTRLETAAGCMLKHFLKYGLRLEERKVYRFERTDAGLLMHESLDRFAEMLRREELAWTDLPAEKGTAMISQALRETAASYRDLVAYGTARSARSVDRMERILIRAVDALQYQLGKGEFVPSGYEVDFGRPGSPGQIRYELSGGRWAVLEGRVDRFDIAESDGKRYIKILDYKSGHRDIEPEKVREGLQLQLPVYMEAVASAEQALHPGEIIVPAAMLYYRFDDPVLESKGAAPEEDPQNLAQIRRSLRPTGILLAEDEAVRLLDREFITDSDVIPVRRNKDGALRASKQLLSAEEFRQLREDAGQSIRTLSERILDGSAAADPVKMNSRATTCTYCPYRDACGFDPKTPGYGYREIGKA